MRTETEFIMDIRDDATLNVIKVNWTSLRVEVHGASLEGLWHACVALVDGLGDIISLRVLGGVS